MPIQRKARDSKPKVADLFCGAGGFSEGFRQKGFSLAYGLDYWWPAIKTSRYNHPHCRYEYKNILDLDVEQLDKRLFDVEIILASPPCVSFSRSNKMGKADKTKGIELIEKTMGLIAYLKEHGRLKYWVVENVPNAKKYVKNTYGWDHLGLPGKGDDLEIVKKKVYNSEFFGVPQRRKRLFFGDFPEPNREDTDGTISVEKVFSKLRDPQSNKDDIAGTHIADPCYDDLRIEVDELTDHFYDTRVSKKRWDRARELKEDHGFMGTVPFPDELDRPSRTVMATRSASSREAMLFGVGDIIEGRYEKYRLPTIREIATFMSFPITYQFLGLNESAKYRLVGNAVACKMSAAIAESIAFEMGMDVPDDFIPLKQKGNLECDLTGSVTSFPKLRKRKPKFSKHIDYLKEHGFIVVLNNKISNFQSGDLKWDAVLHKNNWGYGEKTSYPITSLQKLKKSNTLYENCSANQDIKWQGFEYDLYDILKENITSSKKFLNAHINRSRRFGPRNLLKSFKDLIDEHFPKKKFHEIYLENEDIIDINTEKIPVRIVAGMIACKSASRYLNGLIG